MNNNNINKIKFLYFLTPVVNVETILRFGILPRNEAIKKDLIKKDISDNEIQIKRAKIKFRLPDYSLKSAHDLTNFYFAFDTTNNFRMCENDNNVALFCISRELLRSKDHWFVFTDAHLISKYRSREYQNLEDLEKLPWDIINSDYQDIKDNGEKIQRKMSEFLVYPKVEPCFFERIIVPTNEIKSEVSSLLRRTNCNATVSFDRNVFRKINRYVYR